MNPDRGTTEWFVLEFRANKIAFHVAYTALTEYKGFTEDLALTLLWPPMEEGEDAGTLFSPGPMPDDGNFKDWMVP